MIRYEVTEKQASETPVRDLTHFLFFKLFCYFYVYGCLALWVSVQQLCAGHTQTSEEYIRFLGPGVIGGCKFPVIGVEPRSSVRERVALNH